MLILKIERREGQHFSEKITLDLNFARELFDEVK